MGNKGEESPMVLHVLPSLKVPGRAEKQEPTRLGAEWLAVLLGQEKSSI